MDIHLRIIRHAGIGVVSYSAKLTIGRTDLALPKDSEQVFWCAAAGKNLTACIAAVKERALLWAIHERVRIISGLLTEAGPCELVLDIPSDIVLVPVTYNDWLTEKHP
jgi:hypothetical protein